MFDYRAFYEIQLSVSVDFLRIVQYIRNITVRNRVTFGSLLCYLYFTVTAKRSSEYKALNPTMLLLLTVPSTRRSFQKLLKLTTFIYKFTGRLNYTQGIRSMPTGSIVFVLCVNVCLYVCECVCKFLSANDFS